MHPKCQSLDINEIRLVCINPLKQDIKKKNASDVPPCDSLIARVCNLYRLSTWVFK